MTEELRQKAEEWCLNHTFADTESAEEYYYKTYPVTLNIGEEERKKEVIDIFLAGYKKANEWHYVKDGDLPKAYQKCYFIYSNYYNKDGEVDFSESSVSVRTGLYAFYYDEEGEETTDPCFYDDIVGDEIDPSEVYAWKEIVLPELKESE